MKKITGFSLLLLFLAVSGYCQYHVLAKRKHKTDRPKTWGLIIGISQYENIPGVKYADNDAEAFYNFWVNAAGGPRISPDHVRLLLNDSARTSEIYGRLEWLRRSVKKNDVVVIYFSGHGDGTRESGDNQGYLLAANAFEGGNFNNGTIAVKYLRKYLNSFVDVNKAKKVLLFVDACGSGSLTGGEGLAITRGALQNYHPHLVSVLSAQKSELSYSGKMWGNGHSVFSWYLLKGLQGFANHNNDNLVTAAELANYLSFTVPDATGNAQHPIVAGDRGEVITRLKAHKIVLIPENMPDTVLTPGELGSGIAEKLDTDIRAKYRQFLDDIKNRRLTWGTNDKDTANMACSIYESMLKSPRAAVLYPSLRSSLLVALLRGPEQFLDMLTAGRKIAAHYHSQDADIEYLKKMVSPSDILYGYVMARYYVLKSTSVVNDREAISMLNRSLVFEPEAPYTLELFGERYLDLHMPDSAIYYYKKAMIVAPGWAELHNMVGTIYEGLKDYDKAMQNYQMALKIDSNNTEAYNAIGVYYQEQNAYDKALAYHKKAVALQEKVKSKAEDQYRPGYYFNLGTDYIILKDYDNALDNYLKAFSYDSTSAKIGSNLGGLYMMMRDFDHAIVYLDRTTRLDSTYTDAWYLLGTIHTALKQYREAIKDFRKVIALNPDKYDGRLMLGYNLVANGDLDEGKKELLKATDIMLPDGASWYVLARGWSLANDPARSLACLKTAFDDGWNNYDMLIGDEALAEVRTDPGFAGLLKKYFPEKQR